MATSVAPTSVRVDPKTTARSVFKGVFDKDMQNLSVEEQIDFSPRVRFLKDKIDRKKEKIDASAKKLEAYEKLRVSLTKFRDQVNYFRKPESREDNAFERKSAKVTSTEGSGDDFLKVTASAGAINSNFTVKINQLATRHVIKIGQSGIEEAEQVKNAIDRAETLEAAGEAVNALEIAELGGVPTNPFVRILYSYLVSQVGLEVDLADVKAQINEMFAEMQKSPISDGFDSLESQAVKAVGGAGAMLREGNYVLSSMAGQWNIADNLKEYLEQAKDVAEAIVAIGDDPISRASITEAIAGIPGLDYDGDDGQGLPINNPLARSIAQAAWDEAGAGGAEAAEVIAATTATASAQLVKNALVAKFEELCPVNSDYRKNPFANFIINKIKTASSAAGATIDSIFNAVEAGYNEFISKCTISLENGDTLQNVLDKINATTEYSGVQAEAVDIIGNGSLVLQISSVNTGIDYNISITNNLLETDLKGEFLGDTTSSNEEPQNAELLIDNFFISSSSNTVKRNDKVSIKLLKPNTGLNSQKVTISENIDVTLQYIGRFVDQFNQMAALIAQQTARDPITYEYKETATLGGDRFVNQIKSFLFNFVTRGLSYDDGGYRSIQDLGLKLVDAPADLENGIPAHKIIEIDEEVLINAIEENFSQFRRVFEFKAESSDPALSVTSHTGSYYGIEDMKISIHPVGATMGPDAKRVKVDFMQSDGVEVRTEYYDLSGIEGAYTIKFDNASSSLYGITMSFASSDDKDDINLSIKQGVADQLYGFVYRYTDDLSKAQMGTISSEEQRMALDAGRDSASIQELEKRLQIERDRKSAEIAAKMQSSTRAQMDTKIMEAYMDAMQMQ
jgi:hypothetical protein